MHGVVVAAAAGLMALAPAAQLTAGPTDTLVVFAAPQSGSGVAADFASVTQVELAELAASMDVAFKVIDIDPAAAVPQAVRLTPLIVFQNHRGRSVYQGRFKTLDRVRNFVRTATHRPQTGPGLPEAAVLERPGVPFETRGRMRLATPIKVTDLAGHLPEGFDAQAFTRDATQWVRDAAAARGATVDTPAQLRRSDRQFYLDVYPHRAADGTLSLGIAAYSQFHCHDPVFVQTQAPLSGPWSDRAALFGRAYGVLMDAVDQVIAGAGDGLGDGFDPVRAGATTLSWEALGLALPEAPANAAPPPAPMDRWPTQWVMVDPGAGAPPAVQFAFPAPHDAYRGEATRVSGTLTLAADAHGGGILAQATGRFVVDPASVTMGEADLDAAIHESMLDVQAHPESFFVLDTTRAQAVAPAFGVLAPAVLQGPFTMKGHTLPLTVTASFEPVTTARGEVRLVLDARWSLGLLRPFGIDGPSGDEENGDSLEFEARLVFAPVGG